MNAAVVGLPYKMRAPCGACGHEFGSITETGSQDVVRCDRCDRFQYNAPRVETGRAVRTVQTTHEAIKPKLRMAVLVRANGRCEICGKGPGDGHEIHVAHIVSVRRGLEMELSDAEINHEENLLAACDECNLGLGKETIPLRMMIRVLMARMARAQ